MYHNHLPHKGAGVLVTPKQLLHPQILSDSLDMYNQDGDYYPFLLRR